jgi:hypothetical protein
MSTLSVVDASLPDRDSQGRVILQHGRSGDTKRRKSVNPLLMSRSTFTIKDLRDLLVRRGKRPVPQGTVLSSRYGIKLSSRLSSAFIPNPSVIAVHMDSSVEPCTSTLRLLGLILFPKPQDWRQSVHIVKGWAHKRRRNEGVTSNSMAEPLPGRSNSITAPFNSDGYY